MKRTPVYVEERTRLFACVAWNGCGYGETLTTFLANAAPAEKIQIWRRRGVCLDERDFCPLYSFDRGREAFGR